MSEIPTTQFRDSCTHFAGFDWAKDKHDVVIVNRDGRVVEQFQFDDSAQGWSDFRQRVAPYSNLAITVETNCGPVVERLLQLGLAVYPVRPLAAARYRER